MMVLTLADGGFKIFTALQELNLSHNKIGPDGVNALAAGFKFMTAFQKLKIMQ